eukprot:8309587-Alexandrium_andersonii.AAC.1
MAREPVYLSSLSSPANVSVLKQVSSASVWNPISSRKAQGAGIPSARRAAACHGRRGGGRGQ